MSGRTRLVDPLTPERRSAHMARIRVRNTEPELAVRRLLHSMGYRFRLHRHDLPGKPDIILPRHRKAIFVHGCYWHGHGCSAGQLPKTRLEFWAPKIAQNRARDVRNYADMRLAGWSVTIVWECQTRDAAVLGNLLSRFLASPCRRFPLRRINSRRLVHRGERVAVFRIRCDPHLFPRGRPRIGHRQ